MSRRFVELAREHGLLSVLEPVVRVPEPTARTRSSRRRGSSARRGRRSTSARCRSRRGRPGRDHALCARDRRGAAGAVGRALAGRRRRTSSRARSRPRARAARRACSPAARSGRRRSTPTTRPSSLRTLSVPRLQRARPRSSTSTAALAARSVRIRGVIEGFYGPPWTHEERLDLIRFCGAHGLNTWVHAPKDDPYHRKLWREPYPDDELARLAELVAEAERHGVEFVVRDRAGPRHLLLDDESELETLVAKCEQVRSARRRARSSCSGTTSSTSCTAPRTRRSTATRSGRAAPRRPFSTASRASSSSPGRSSSARWATPAPATRRTAALRRRGSTRRSSSTGPAPRSCRSAITREALDLAVHRFRGHELLLWDNYPVNDFAPETAASSGRCAAATRGSPTGSCARDRRERDGAGGAVEARARDGRRLGARPARVRAVRVVRARAARARRGGASRRCARSRPSRADVERPADVAGARATRSLLGRRRGDWASRCSSRSCDGRRRLRRDRGRRRGRRRRAAGRRARRCSSSRAAHVGGMVSGGLSWTDVGDARVLGGFARRFYAAVADHYGAAALGGEGAGAARRRASCWRAMLDGVDVRLGDDGAARRRGLRRRELRGRPDGAPRRAVRGRPRVARALRRDVGGAAARVPAGEAQLRR